MALKAIFLFVENVQTQAVSAPFLVSINPDTITVQTEANKNTIQGVNGAKGTKGVNQKAAAEPIVQYGGTGVKFVSMLLHMDVVDQYEKAHQGKGVLSATAGVMGFDLSKAVNLSKQLNISDELKFVVSKVTDFTKISLLNPSCSCYSLLEKAAEGQLPVVFAWGPMTYCGLITQFSSRFVYFSDMGAPLRAEVNITLTCKNGTDPIVATKAMTTVKENKRNNP